MFSFRKKKEPEIHPENETQREKMSEENQLKMAKAVHGFCSEPSLVDLSDTQPSTVPSTEAPLNESEEQQAEDVSNLSEALESQLHISSPAQEAKEQQQQESSSSAALQNSPALVSVSSPLPSSPKDALYLACKNAHSFMQTWTQVLQEHQHISRPREDSVILFQKNLKTTAEAVMQEMNKTVPLSSAQSQPASSLSRLVYNGVTWTAYTAASAALKVYHYATTDADDYDDHEVAYEEQADDVMAESVALVPWDKPVVCVPLVSECVAELLASAHCDGNDALKVLCIHKKGDYSFAAWAADASPIAQGLQRHDLDLLQHVLVEAGHAVLSGDYIVLGNVKNTKETDIDVAVACARLHQEIEFYNRLIERSSKQAADLRELVTKKKLQGDMKGALAHYKRCKVLEAKIDNDRATQLNLEQALSTLETTHFNKKHVLEPLKAATSALKACREECSLEDADNVMLDLQDEMEEANEITSTLVGHIVDDEDALMAELEQLMKEESTEEATTEEKVEEESTEEKESNAVESQVRPGVNEKENEITSNEVAAAGSASVGGKQGSQSSGQGNGLEEATKDSAIEAPAV